MLAAGLRGVASDLGLVVAEDAVVAVLGERPRLAAVSRLGGRAARLQERFRLGVITNCDTDLFAASADRLGVAFDWVVTAEAARAYKPSLAPFELAFATIGRRAGASSTSRRASSTTTSRRSSWASIPSGSIVVAPGPGSGRRRPPSAAPDATFAGMAAFADAACV